MVEVFKPTRYSRGPGALGKPEGEAVLGSHTRRPRAPGPHIMGGHNRCNPPWALKGMQAPKQPSLAQQATRDRRRLLRCFATGPPLRVGHYVTYSKTQALRPRLISMLAKQAKRKVLALRTSAQALFAFFHGRYSTGIRSLASFFIFQKNSTAEPFALGPEACEARDSFEYSLAATLWMVACHSRTCNIIAKINCIC